MTAKRYLTWAMFAFALVATIGICFAVLIPQAAVHDWLATAGSGIGFAFAGLSKPQYRIRRKVASMAYSAGGQLTQDLPRDYDYEVLVLRITGSLQVTGVATSVRAEAPCQLVSRVEVVSDGKNTLFNAPFWFASLGSYDRSLLQSGGRATTPPTSPAVATYAVEAIGSVDFMTPDGVHPKDTNFRPSGLSLFQLRLSFGQPGDAFVGGTVVAVAGMAVEVFAAQVIEQAGTDGTYTNPIGLKKVSTQQIAVLATNSGQEIRLPAGNFVKSILLRAEGAVTALEPSAAVINNIIMQNGVDVRWNLSGAQTRALNNLDYGQITTGYYITDFTTKGRAPINLSELWDVTNPAEPKAILDVTGGASNNVQAVITEYIMAG